MAAPSARTGRIVDWRDDAGFGFIEEPGQRGRLFVHISGFVPGMPRPSAGDEVTFAIGEGREGRPAARDVRIIRATANEPSRRTSATRDLPRHIGLRVAAALVLIFLVVAGVALQRIDPLVASAYLGMGLLSAAMYGHDKWLSQQEQKRWRTPEATLHLIDLCSGIVGGLLAQAVFRHKTSKTDFAATTAIIYALHLGAIIFLIIR